MPKPSRTESSVVTALKSSPCARRKSPPAGGLPGGGPGTDQAPKPVSKPSLSVDSSADQHLGVVDERAHSTSRGVGDIADRDLDLLARVGREVECHLLPAVRITRHRVPLAAGAGCRAGITQCQVVEQERVLFEQEPGFAFSRHPYDSPELGVVDLGLVAISLTAAPLAHGAVKADLPLIE